MTHGQTHIKYTIKNTPCFNQTQSSQNMPTHSLSLAHSLKSKTRKWWHIQNIYMCVDFLKYIVDLSCMTRAITNI